MRGTLELEHFGTALETYIAKHIRKQKRAKDTERELRNYLLAAWKRPAP